MNEASKQAFNKARTNPKKVIRFDIEGTGLGKLKGQQLAAPVGIWQIGYGIDDQEPKALFGKTDIPFEPGALRLYKDDVADNLPGPYSRMPGNKTEKQILTEFGSVLKENKGAILEGYNIKGYDVPALMQGFKRYGMNEELSALESMELSDIQDVGKEFLLKTLSPDAKDALGLSDNSRYILGTRQENLARGFGIDIDPSRLHEAGYDVDILKQLSGKLADQESEFNVYSWASSVDESWNRIEGEPMTPSYVRRLRKAVRKNKDALMPMAVNREELPWSSDAKEVTSAYKDIIPESPKSTWSSKLKGVKASINESLASPEFKNGVKEVTSVLSNKMVQKTALGVALGAIGIAAYKKFKDTDFGFGDDESDYISSSSLGKKEDDILKAIRGSKDLASFNKASERYGSGQATALNVGTATHRLIQKEWGDRANYLGMEVPVRDKELGIKGAIDVLIKEDGKEIPVELKSTTAENLANMTDAEDEHKSQANFYAHAKKAPYSYIMYIDKEDLNNRQVYKIPYSPGKLINDVRDFRSVLLQNRSTPGALAAWAKQSEEYFKGVPAGIRSSDSSESSYGGTEGIKPHKGHGFPGGREQLFGEIAGELFSATRSRVLSNIESSIVTPDGIRSEDSSESSYGGFEEIKSHNEYGFPGGRIQPFGARIAPCTKVNNNIYKIRDQATKHSHLFPIGTPVGISTINGSRYIPRN